MSLNTDLCVLCGIFQVVNIIIPNVFYIYLLLFLPSSFFFSIYLPPLSIPAHHTFFSFSQITSPAIPFSNVPSPPYKGNGAFSHSWFWNKLIYPPKDISLT